METAVKVFEGSIVERAIKVMNPHSNYISKETDVEKLLNDLNLFSSRMVDALVETGEEEELKTLIFDSAEVILKFYHSLGEKRHQLLWGDTREKMVSELKQGYPDLFEKAELLVEKEIKERNYEYDIKNLEKNEKKKTTALISSKEEANQRKFEIQKAYDELKDRISFDNILDKVQISNLLDKLEKSRLVTYEFVDEKLEEEPVRLKYYKTGNRISVKLNLNRNSYSYRQGRGKEIRRNRGKDRDQFPLVVSVSYIDDFLYQNGIRDEDLLIDNDSVDRFYIFESEVSHNLTPSFLEKWYDYDCPNLYRIEPNKKRHTNMLGMRICHFQTLLVESSWSSVYIDNDITEEEAKKIITINPQTWIAEEIRNLLEAREIEESEEIKKMEKFIKEFDEQVQQTVDENRNDILTRLHQRFPNISQLNKDVNGNIEIKINESSFGLDCGFIFIKALDKKYEKYRSILKNINSSYSEYMDIQLPYEGQSVTVKRALFEIVKTTIYHELGIQLTAHTVLD